ncbi:MAG: Terminase-like family protein [Candidatus Hydrogenedentes bacterium ADurb.Bin170]|nr:MAG: Terminase-like family protein [Candidatus Hydrogenedentes bacterium ADurb.Bin170]
MKSKRYKLFPKQKDAWKLLEDPAFRRYLFDGGARSGKTDVILVWLIKEAMTRPGARILIARWRLDHARTTLWNLSLKKILPPGIGGVRYHESAMEARFPNGSMIRVGGLDDAERVDKILGDEYLHIFINEATQVSWDTVTKVMTRLSQQIAGAVRKLILDCNPKGPQHWLHQVGVQHVQPSADRRSVQPLPDAAAWARMHWTPYDNPYLPDDTLRTLEALPGIMRRRMLNGEWCNNEGTVYPMFDPDLHCVDEMPPGSEDWPRYRSIDFGFTNPFCCLWGAVDGDGRLWVYRELYRRETQIAELAEIIKATEHGHFRTVADPEDSGARDALANAGIDTMEADKAVSVGIQAVQLRLVKAGDDRPRLFIHSGCINMISEFFEYRWAENKEGRNADEKPVKDSDHAMDALRYMVRAVDNPAVYGAAAAPAEFKPGSARDLARYF